MAEPAIAHLAKNRPDLARLVIVIDVHRRPFLTDRTKPALRLDHLVDFCGPDAEPLLEVIVPRVPVIPFDGRFGTAEMTGLAIGVPPIPISTVAVKFFEWLRLATIWAASHLAPFGGCAVPSNY